MPFFALTFALFIAAMLAAYGLARVLTGVARDVALRRGIVSEVTHRSSHVVPTPRLGGVGLAAGFGLASTIWLGGIWLLPTRMAVVGGNATLVGWVALGWLGMLAVGWLDDVRDLPPLVKMALMTVAATMPLMSDTLRFALALGGWVPSGWDRVLGTVLVVGWILFFTNGFNFMDGMDGFAANFARASALFLFGVLLLSGFRYGTLKWLRVEAFVLPILAMACWGFLHWNRPPARVFMGDGGSLSTGYLLAVYPLLGARGALGLPLSPLTSLTILMPFVFDVVLTLARRAGRGENLLRAHREHLYQRLMQTGLSHGEVLKMNLRRFALCGGAAWVGHLFDAPVWRWACLGVALGVMVQYWLVTLVRERRLRG